MAIQLVYSSRVLYEKKYVKMQVFIEITTLKLKYVFEVQFNNENVIYFIHKRNRYMQNRAILKHVSKNTTV